MRFSLRSWTVTKEFRSEWSALPALRESLIRVTLLKKRSAWTLQSPANEALSIGVCCWFWFSILLPGSSVTGLGRLRGKLTRTRRSRSQPLPGYQLCSGVWRGVGLSPAFCDVGFFNNAVECSVCFWIRFVLLNVGRLESFVRQFAAVSGASLASVSPLPKSNFIGVSTVFCSANWLMYPLPFVVCFRKRSRYVGREQSNG